MPTEVGLKDGAVIMRQARRVAVAGVSGAGKSTLSQRIADRLGLRYVSLDRDMRWLPGWQVRPRDAQRRLHDGFVAQENWGIDGTSIGLMDTRLPRADVLIWMRPPRHVALAGIAWRVVTSHGRTRADMAEGCPEQLPDREFLRWIWNFERDQAPRLIQAVDRFAPARPVLTLTSRRDANRLLALLDEKGPRR